MSIESFNQTNSQEDLEKKNAWKKFLGGIDRYVKIGLVAGISFSAGILTSRESREASEEGRSAMSQANYDASTSGYDYSYDASTGSYNYSYDSFDHDYSYDMPENPEAVEQKIKELEGHFMWAMSDLDDGENVSQIEKLSQMFQLTPEEDEKVFLKKEFIDWMVNNLSKESVQSIIENGFPSAEFYDAVVAYEKNVGKSFDGDAKFFMEAKPLNETENKLVNKYRNNIQSLLKPEK